MTDNEECIFLENDLIKYLICNQCGLVLRKPTRLHPCGHTFCQTCTPSASTKCPQCSSVFQAKQPDLTANNLISDLQVRCTAPDCPFQGSYQAFIMAHKNNCAMRRCGGIDIWLSQAQLSLQQMPKPGAPESLQKDCLKEPKAISLSEHVQDIFAEKMDRLIDLQQQSNNQEIQQCFRWQQPEGNKPPSQTFIECIEIESHEQASNNSNWQKNSWLLFGKNKAKLGSKGKSDVIQL